MLQFNVSRFSSPARIILLILLTTCSHAFFPTVWKEQTFGNNGVSHIEQTEQAFQTLATRYFPTIKSLSKSMLSARDTITEANADVDKDQDQAAWHCDGESFDAAQVRLMTLQSQVLDFLAKDNPTEARKALGSALHTVQDFYSHSNWVEMGNPAISDVLGRATSMPHAQPLDHTCVPCAPHDHADITDTHCLDCRENEVGFTSLLTSGYYFGEDVSKGGIPDFKCHHGGYTDNPLSSTMGFITPKFLADPLGGINKDSLNCGWSPHAYAHPQAVAFAIDATIQYVDDIKQKIPNAQLRQLFGVGSTLAFVIDTTGSMSDIEDAVTALSIAIVTERLGTPDEPSSYVVSPFNDPGTGPVTTTSDFAVFQSTMQSLTASGGGDCPELSMGGILDAITVLDEGSVLFMFTDAASKDAELAGDVISAATAKYINLYIFKFDSSCDDSIVDKREDSASNEVYSAVALATGGQYYSLPRSEVATIGGIIDTLTSMDNNFILRVSDTLKTAPITYIVPVDSYMTQITFSLHGAGMSMTVNQPSGLPLDLTTATIASVILSDGSFVTIQFPVAGYWTVTVSGTGDFSLDAIGISAVHFASFNFAALAGRPGHTGYFPLNTLPPYNAQIAAIAEMSGPFLSATFTFRNPAGIIVTTLDMTSGSGNFGDPPSNSYFTLLRLSPSAKFVYVNGFDTAGTPFQRLLPSVITPIFSNTTFIVDNGTSTTTSNVTVSANSTTSLPSASSTTSGTALFGNGTSMIMSTSPSTNLISNDFSTVSTDFTSATFGNCSSTIPFSLSTEGLPSKTSSASFNSLVSSIIGSGNSTYSITSSTSLVEVVATGLPSMIMHTFSNASVPISSTGSPKSTPVTGEPAVSITTIIPTPVADISGSGGFTITEIVYTTTTFCPTTVSITVSGIPTFVITGSISTITVTSTIIVACNKCPNPSSMVTLTPTGSPSTGPVYAFPGSTDTRPVTITEIIYTVTSIFPATIGTSIVSGSVSYLVTNTISIITLKATSTASCEKCGPHYATVTVLLLGRPSSGGREYTPIATLGHSTLVLPTRVYGIPPSNSYGYGNPSITDTDMGGSSPPITITMSFVSPPYVPTKSQVEPPDNSDTFPLVTSLFPPYGPEETDVLPPEYFGTTTTVSSYLSPYGPEETNGQPLEYSGTINPASSHALNSVYEVTNPVTPVYVGVTQLVPIVAPDYGPAVTSSAPSRFSMAPIPSAVPSTGVVESNVIPPVYSDITILVSPVAPSYGPGDSVPLNLEYSGTTTAPPTENVPVVSYGSDSGAVPSANPSSTDAIASSTPGYQGPYFTGGATKGLDVFGQSITFCIMLAVVVGMVML